MKKIITILACVALALVMAMGSVSADEISPDASHIDPNGMIQTPGTGEMVVKYSVGSETYQVTIPSSVEFSSPSYEVSAEVVVDKVVLTEGRYLNISVSSTHEWNMTKHDTSGPDSRYVIPYTMTYTAYTWVDGRATDNGEQTTVPSATNTGSDAVVLLQAHGISTVHTNTLTFKMSDEKIPAKGNYQDKLTFTVSVEGIVST